MTEYERNVRRGLSAVRRVARRTDANLEKLERWLKRQAQRKTVPRKVSDVDTGIQMMDSLMKAVRDLESSLAGDYVTYIG